MPIYYILSYGCPCRYSPHTLLILTSRVFHFERLGECIQDSNIHWSTCASHGLVRVKESREPTPNSQLSHFSNKSHTNKMHHSSNTQRSICPRDRQFVWCWKKCGMIHKYEIYPGLHVQVPTVWMSISSSFSPTLDYICISRPGSTTRNLYSLKDAAL
jgi:hypothetical protein